LWRKFDQYEPGSNFFAWACQIIRYEVLKYREKRARAARLLDPDVFDRLAEVAVKQMEHLDEFHRRALVDCMERLSAGDRDLMRKRYSEALQVRAIAAAMNRSPNAVSKSLGRIRRLLLDCINSDSMARERQGGAA
jgi:RNA polymerase sigma-70 factor, ECF subfamily